MPTPPKPAEILKLEKASHRTKKELEQRSSAEKSLLSGVPMQEEKAVKNTPTAHREYIRIKGILSKIGKNDALYQAVINRYCLLKAECAQMESKREDFYESVKKLESRFYDNDGCELTEMEFYQMQVKLQSSVIACDKQIQAKRRMMFDIEKECIMTISSALRSIPKKPEDEAEDDPFADLVRLQAQARQRFTANSG